jgi:hypothetical protein
MGELMLCSAIFEKFVSKSPISVMARATMEHALTADSINALFLEHADEQYTRKLMFSSVVDLMSVVVSRIQPTVNAAFQAVLGTLPVSLTALYDKLNGVETQVTSALVKHVAGRLAPVVAAMGGRLPDLVPHYVFEFWTAIILRPPSAGLRLFMEVSLVRCLDTRSSSWTQRRCS